jgi:hypothetical protein
MHLSKKYLVAVFFLLLAITPTYIDVISGKFFTGFAYNELFVNYSNGFVRRGLFGSILINIYQAFNIHPNIIIGFTFLTIYCLNILIIFKLLKRYKDFFLIYIFILLNPSLILFNIYDHSTIFLKDCFSIFTILLHSFIFSLNNKERYLFLFKLILVPLLIISILIHELQIFFMTIHFLITLRFLQKYPLNLKNIINYYFLLLLVALLVIFLGVGTYDHYLKINETILNLFKSDIKVNLGIAGNFNAIIGNFIKIHFFYYYPFYSYFYFYFCILASIFLIYIFTHYLIIKKIVILSKIKIFFYIFKINVDYRWFFIPSLFLFFFADHGRTLNLISFHLIAFFFILNLNKKKINLFYKKTINNFVVKNFIILFLFFYLFFYFTPFNGGLIAMGPGPYNNEIFKLTLGSEVTKSFKIFYNYINGNITELPYIGKK